MAPFDGPRYSSKREMLESEIESGISNAVYNDKSLEGLISGDGIRYLARRAADRTLSSGADADDAIKEAGQNFGRVARELHQAAAARRSIGFARTPTSEDEVIRLVEVDDEICGIFPFC